MISHIFVRNRTDGCYEFICIYCEDVVIPKLPCPLPEFEKKIKAFQRKHRKCKPGELPKDSPPLSTSV